MERHEIRQPFWKMALLVLGLLAFTALGIAITIFGDGIAQQAAGVLCIAFFGVGGAAALYAISKGRGNIAVLSSGLEIWMFGSNPRVVPWRDIESIGTMAVASQQFTTIKLKNYASLIDGLSDAEAAAALKKFGALRALGQATVVVAAANQQSGDAGDVIKFLSGSSKVRSLVDVLRHLRLTYGAEIMLGWNMRDRSAAEFADYLNDRRRSAA